MTTFEIDIEERRSDPHVFEVLGRVVGVLCDVPGPLANALAFRLWPLLSGNGFALSWHGATPTADNVVSFLLDTASNDRPFGAVELVERTEFITVTIGGVQFQLRPEPMLDADDFAVLTEYWRTGTVSSGSAG
ncbi:hypothetical protein [Nocardia lasii]|uniref:Uncharacterized protein n=1 Tax=Nocardia lasii TaxID=1616107 RepID=A0ABW1JM56_9NOCA